MRPNLAISLHAPTRELRRELMPIEDRYDIDDVIAAAQRYPIPHGGAVTYEYVLLGGVNDQPGHARALVRLLRATSLAATRFRAVASFGSRSCSWSTGPPDVAVVLPSEGGSRMSTSRD